MLSKSVAFSFSLVLCATVASAQDEWIQYPGNPVIESPSSGTWESEARAVEGLVVVNGTYHLFFTATATEPLRDHAIGHATSTDGINWQMDTANPVLTPETEGSWEVKSLISAAVYHDGELFHMWYGGDDYEHVRVGYATSPDGTSWTRHPGNPVLSEGPSGSFDAWWIAPNDVLYHNGLYQLWYGASPTPGITNGDSIGYASSTDGVNWTRYPDPVLEPTTGWENFAIYGVGTIFDGSTYHMWYPGYESIYGRIVGIAIGYATSADGVNWVRDPDNPIEELGEVVSQPQVIRNDAIGGYEMIYTHDFPFFTVLRATSTCCSVNTSMWILPAAGFGAGAEGAFYVTDVDVSNPSASPVQYRFAWLPRGQANTEWTWSDTFQLAAGASARYENVLSGVFGLEPDAYGALVLESSFPDVLTMGRIFSTASAGAAGTFGQAVPAIRADAFIPSGTTRRLIFGTQNEDTRFNVGCQNASSETLVVNLDLIGADGTYLGRRKLTLAPWGNGQVNQIFNSYAPVKGSVDISTAAGTGAFYCYGSMLDNDTNDPTTIPPL